jgi:hypothetical protein
LCDIAFSRSILFDRAVYAARGYPTTAAFSRAGIGAGARPEARLPRV